MENTNTTAGATMQVISTHSLISPCCPESSIEFAVYDDGTVEIAEITHPDCGADLRFESKAQARESYRRAVDHGYRPGC